MQVYTYTCKRLDINNIHVCREVLSTDRAEEVAVIIEESEGSVATESS